MKIEIIAIGNEVLNGFTINTNAAFIAKELLRIGLPITQSAVLPDDHDILKEELQRALDKNALVIVSGGLGPTLDDITRKVAAELFHSDFYYNEEIGEELERKYAHLPASVRSSLRDQATIPEKAVPIKNTIGTAPGLIFRKEHAMLILVPGVPLEMENMIRNEVIPFIEKHYGKGALHFQKMIHLFNLPESSVDPFLREFKQKDPALQVGIYPSQGTLTVRLAHPKADGVAGPYEILKEKFQANVFEAADGKIEEAIHNLFISKRLTLGIAESCTGGHVAAKLTKIPGASEYFKGSLVAYANELKQKLLGVSAEDLQVHGAVSEAVAKQMAKGVLQIMDCDYALAITGIAGPGGGSAQKPVGTVYGAVCKRGEEPHVVNYFIPRNRAVIIERASNLLLADLLSFAK